MLLLQPSWLTFTPLFERQAVWNPYSLQPSTFYQHSSTYTFLLDGQLFILFLKLILIAQGLLLLEHWCGKCIVTKQLSTHALQCLQRHVNTLHCRWMTEISFLTDRLLINTKTAPNGHRQMRFFPLIFLLSLLLAPLASTPVSWVSHGLWPKVPAFYFIFLFYFIFFEIWDNFYFVNHMNVLPIQLT